MTSLTTRAVLAILTALIFVVALPVGVTIEFGAGFGLMALGVTCGVASYFLGAVTE